MALAYTANAAESDSLTLYNCYSMVRLRGELHKIDLALNRIMMVVTIQNRVHSLTDGVDVQVEAIASSSALELDRAKEKVTENAIRRFLQVINQPISRIEVVYLGCAETPLKR